jgi:hypothetical protein
MGATARDSSGTIWDPSKWFAWGLDADSISRTPEERAEMLERLGFKNVAYSWGRADIRNFDRQIEAYLHHGIKVTAWGITDVNEPGEKVDWRAYQIPDISDPVEDDGKPVGTISLGELLELFKRHKIAPQLWLMRRMRAANTEPLPQRPQSEWTDEESNHAFRNYIGYDLTPQSMQAERVRKEAERIVDLARMVAPVGIQVGLYKHGGWIGITDNAVEVVKYVRSIGVRNVGIVYQFIHAHDEVDDTEHFESVWREICPFVLAVNVTGLHAGRTEVYPIIYPSQGDLEISMLKVIQDSGWKGPIGLAAEKGGDAEVNLRNNIVGVRWISTELREPGRAGARPFAVVR